MATCKGDRAAHAQLGGEGGGGAAKADAQGQGGAQDKAPPAITEPPRAAEGAAEGAEAAGPSADAPADDGVACGPCAPRARELDVREDVAAAMREAIAVAVRADHPEREGHEACQYYHKTGMCKFGQVRVRVGGWAAQVAGWVGSAAQPAARGALCIGAEARPAASA